MTNYVLLALAVILFIGGIIGLLLNRSRAQSQAPISNIAGVQSTDQEMNQAIAEARRTCGEFVAALEVAGDHAENFTVKMRAPTRSGGHEHFWVSDLSYRDGVFRGVVSDPLADVPSLKQGDEVEVAASEISDWMYMEGEGPDMAIVGGLTLRVLRDRATPQERAGYWAAVRFKGE